VINAKGELVGLVFDGNIQALPVVYKADAIVKELVAGATPAAH